MSALYFLKNISDYIGMRIALFILRIYIWSPRNYKEITNASQIEKETKALEKIFKDVTFLFQKRHNVKIRIYQSGFGKPVTIGYFQTIKMSTRQLESLTQKVYKSKDAWVREVSDAVTNDPKNIAYSKFLKNIGREEKKIRDFGFDVKIAVISGPDYYNNLKTYLEQQQQQS